VDPSPEEIDLTALTDALRARFGEAIEASYLRGKTLLRDAIAEVLRCSDCQAEGLVETLELQGFVRFPHLADDTHPQGRAVWHLGGTAWA
jgi:hypothetical protein